MRIQANKQATKIRQQLIDRITRKTQRLQSQFNAISQYIKKIVINSSASQLIDLLDTHQITSLQILLVFIERTSTIGLKNNYIIDQMFQQAIISAKECDRIRKNNKLKKSWKIGDKIQDTFPPFFGIPLSLKQVILYKGRQTYVGQVWPINPIPTQQYLIVQILLKMGFIPFVRTNVPPACKIFQTTNRIFSYCLNPWNVDRSCGGSSGGQSGLISSGCSPIGIGTDIGGSCRIPAQWCGLVTLKHGYRYTRLGNCYYGKYSYGIPVKSQICPIAKSAKDITLFMQFIFDGKNYKDIAPHKKDVHLRQSPFDLDFYKKKKLNIGYYSGIEGKYKCSVGHEKVLQDCLRFLQRKGHKIKKIQIPQLIQIFYYFMRIFLSDNTLSVVKQISNKQPPIKQYIIYHVMTMIPWLLRLVLIFLLRKKQPRLAKIIELSKPMQGTEMVKLIYQNTKKRQSKISNYLQQNQIDVWICPGFPLPAIKHGQCSKLSYLLAHSSVWNALHYPVGIVPIRTMPQEDQHIQDGIDDVVTKTMKFNLKQSKNLPLGVQVISFPCQDQVVLQVMQQLDQQFKFRNNFKNFFLL